MAFSDESVSELDVTWKLIKDILMRIGEQTFGLFTQQQNSTE